MVTYYYNQKEHTYYDSYSGLRINSGADFDRFWLSFYDTIQKSKTLLLDCLEMEIEDYECMRMERIFGAWSNEPFLGQPLTEENVKRLRKLRRLAEKKSTNGEEIFRLLEDNDPTAPDFYKTETAAEEFTAVCSRIIKLMGRTKVADCYIRDEDDIIKWYDELLGNYDLESHFFEAEQDLIDHYLAYNRPNILRG